MPNNQEKEPTGLPAKIYFNIFQGHQDGQDILQELSMRFYDRTSISSPVDPNATLVLEGQRQVLLFIMQKCAEGQR